MFFQIFINLITWSNAIEEIFFLKKNPKIKSLFFIMNEKKNIINERRINNIFVTCVLFQISTKILNSDLSNIVCERMWRIPSITLSLYFWFSTQFFFCSHVKLFLPYPLFHSFTFLFTWIKRGRLSLTLTLCVSVCEFVIWINFHIFAFPHTWTLKSSCIIMCSRNKYNSFTQHTSHHFFSINFHGARPSAIGNGIYTPPEKTP